ncbi:hypothetical protein BIW11_04166, partial [Tropilaelaps mercedesae]
KKVAGERRPSSSNGQASLQQPQQAKPAHGGSTSPASSVGQSTKSTRPLPPGGSASGNQTPATKTPPASASGATGNQMKTPNFRAVLDRFDRLCGVSLTPPSLADKPVRLEVSGGGGTGTVAMPKLANVQIRNPKKLPAAAPLSPSLSPVGPSRMTPLVAKSSALAQLPADPTRGKISTDLLRRLKEEVDNRCSGAPITQFFKHQQKKPVFTNRKEVAVKFSIRKQGPATPADKEKTCPAADRTSTTPGGPLNCNSSTLARTATTPNTPTTPGAQTSTTTTVVSGGGYIAPPSTATPTKSGAKARTPTAKMAAGSVCAPTAGAVNRCSPVAVRVTSPAVTSVAMRRGRFRRWEACPPV